MLPLENCSGGFVLFLSLFVCRWIILTQIHSMTSSIYRQFHSCAQFRKTAGWCCKAIRLGRKAWLNIYSKIRIYIFRSTWQFVGVWTLFKRIIIGSKYFMTKEYTLENMTNDMELDNKFICAISDSSLWKTANAATRKKKENQLEFLFIVWNQYNYLQCPMQTIRLSFNHFLEDSFDGITLGCRRIFSLTCRPIGELEI